MARRIDVQVARGTCVSSGFCAATAPDVFVLDENQKSTVRSSPVEESETVWDAVESCPVEAISANDADTGEQIFP